MKRDTYLKIRKQKQKARFLGILTALSLFGYALKDMKNTTKANDEYNGPILLPGKHIDIVDVNGVLYPVKINNFTETYYNAFVNASTPLYDSYKGDKKIIGNIEEYQTVNRTFTNGEYSYITTDVGQSGYVFDKLITTLPDNYVKPSKSKSSR